MLEVLIASSIHMNPKWMSFWANEHTHQFLITGHHGLSARHIKATIFSSVLPFWHCVPNEVRSKSLFHSNTCAQACSHPYTPSPHTHTYIQTTLRNRLTLWLSLWLLNLNQSGIHGMWCWDSLKLPNISFVCVSGACPCVVNIPIYSTNKEQGTWSQ